MYNCNKVLHLLIVIVPVRIDETNFPVMLYWFLTVTTHYLSNPIVMEEPYNTESLTEQMNYYLIFENLLEL